MPPTSRVRRRRNSVESSSSALYRRSSWRLARSGVMLLAAGVVIGAVALTFFPKQQTAQALLATRATLIRQGAASTHLGSLPPAAGTARNQKMGRDSI